MNREEFKKLACSVYTDYDWQEGIMNDKEPFWIPEYRDGWQASYFAVTKLTADSFGARWNLFWDWCEENLSKVPMCFMSNSAKNEEWWGFENEQDAVLFVMKWS